MKRQLLGLAALLGSLINVGAPIAGLRDGGRRTVRSSKRYWPNRSTHPTWPRHWHDISDPVQQEALRAALLKRERRAAVLAENTARATNANWAHGIGKIGAHLTPVPEFSGRLNPFYVAK